MKAKIIIELEFESWFDDEREPKSNEEWNDFFDVHLMPEGSIMGKEINGNQDLICIESYTIDTKIEKDEEL